MVRVPNVSDSTNDRHAVFVRVDITVQVPQAEYSWEKGYRENIAWRKDPETGGSSNTSLEPDSLLMTHLLIVHESSLPGLGFGLADVSLRCTMLLSLHEQNCLRAMMRAEILDDEINTP